MKQRIILILSMVLVVTALVLPPSGVCAFGFCEGCTQQCANEAEGVYTDCMHQTTKPMQQCAKERDDYKSMCNSIFCPGCPISN